MNDSVLEKVLAHIYNCLPCKYSYDDHSNYVRHCKSKNHSKKKWYHQQLYTQSHYGTICECC